ncbi:hypothetical protein F4054_09460 [Candidatus Poribacteria bacterium]|nr:hypothetical protein [Candidatus Poribacteria bacterium]MYG06936.1 hypothetical protein [Candidatus Poribacteria bacterium]MYK22477.1 hypothetical protein [Candidatus Poribacteria bacterium]
MKQRHLSTIVFGFTVSLLLIFALTIQTPAETRGSELEGGLQIWIDVGTEPSNREGEDTFKLGKDDSLAQDFLAGKDYPLNQQINSQSHGVLSKITLKTDKLTELGHLNKRCPQLCLRQVHPSNIACRITPPKQNLLFSKMSSSSHH